MILGLYFFSKGNDHEKTTLCAMIVKMFSDSAEGIRTQSGSCLATERGGCYVLDGVKRYRTIDSDLLKYVLQQIVDR